MFSLFNKNTPLMNSNLRQYIMNSIDLSIKKYIKKDSNIGVVSQEKNLKIINELDESNQLSLRDIDMDLYDKSFSNGEFVGIAIFLSFSFFLHFLYTKN